MAIKTITEFTGRIGNVIVYKWKDKTCMRTRPSRVRQTKETKRMSKLFGKAASISRVIREALQDVLPDHKEPGMRYRLNNVIYQWLQVKDTERSTTGIPFLDGFSFTGNPGYNNLPNRIIVEWGEKVRISIPDMDLASELSAPKKTNNVILGFHLIGCDVERTELVVQKSCFIEKDYGGTVRSEVIEWDVQEIKTLYLVVLSVRYRISSYCIEQLFDRALTRDIEIMGSAFVI